jgi:hypothetical protein
MLRSDPGDDARRIQEGRVIPAGYYADQPYLVKTDDGAWVCVVTTGCSHEGGRGQHVVTMRSFDQGKTWEDRAEVEPSTGPEASWGVLLKTPSGRLFVFYVFNADDYRELPADDPPWTGGRTFRMDSHGHYVFRWSDDQGKSWSTRRVTIPVREFAIDRENSTEGRVRLFWNVGRPVTQDGTVYLTLHKVRALGAGWFTESEGAFVASADLLTLEDPAAASWKTLPDGDLGIRAPGKGGPVAEEQSPLVLSDGSLAVIYRTVAGHPAEAYSRDEGKTWEEPSYLRYADGRKLKHPRAACFAWKLLHGGYVLWFHNHGGRFVGEHPQRADMSYSDRNPAWMSRGWEVETPSGLRLVWGNPEIVLYDDDPCVRMSYPDLLEEKGRLFLSETQKAVARIHEIPGQLTLALRQGPEAFSSEALIREAVGEFFPGNEEDDNLPALPHFLGWAKESPYGQVDRRAGFSIEILLNAGRLDADAPLVSAMHPSMGGLSLIWKKEGVLVLWMSDGRTECSWSSDEGLMLDQSLSHVMIVVDGGPKIITFFVNGRLCDGGRERQFGWGRFSPNFRGVLWEGPMEFSSEGLGAVKLLRFYQRALLAAEAESLFRATTA